MTTCWDYFRAVADRLRQQPDQDGHGLCEEAAEVIVELLTMHQLDMSYITSLRRQVQALLEREEASP